MVSFQFGVSKYRFLSFQIVSFSRRLALGISGNSFIGLVSIRNDITKLLLKIMNQSSYQNIPGKKPTSSAQPAEIIGNAGKSVNSNFKYGQLRKFQIVQRCFLDHCGVPEWRSLARLAAILGEAVLQFYRSINRGC
jgi:hypothetical protein